MCKYWAFRSSWQLFNPLHSIPINVVRVVQSPGSNEQRLFVFDEELWWTPNIKFSTKINPPFSQEKSINVRFVVNWKRFSLVTVQPLIVSVRLTSTLTKTIKITNRIDNIFHRTSKTKNNSWTSSRTAINTLAVCKRVIIQQEKELCPSYEKRSIHHHYLWSMLDEGIGNNLSSPIEECNSFVQSFILTQICSSGTVFNRLNRTVQEENYRLQYLFEHLELEQNIRAFIITNLFTVEDK